MKPCRLAAALVVCSLPACGLLGTHVVNAPPAGAAEASAWWESAADTLPPDLLAAYVAAADAHRAGGSSATYVDVRAFRTMIGGPCHELRLPCPPPEGILERMRDQVKTCDVTRRYGTLWSLTAEQCVKCTPEEAAAIWRSAVESATRPAED